MKIDALIFDIGNVVIAFDWQEAESRFLARSRKGTKLLREELKELIAGFEVGEISQEVFVAIATRTTGFQGDGREFIAIWNSVFRPNPPMERSIGRLKTNFPLFLLSNTSEPHLEYLQRNFEILEQFVDGVYSFRAKCAKPDQKIFQVAINQFGVTPESTLYIDDLAANVHAALGLGFPAIQYDLREHAEFERRLDEIGISA
jgi:putative hydrolase of the HAD superfamily